MNPFKPFKMAPEVFSIAPMMGYSHRHARFLWRTLSPHAYLYTEMINENAITLGKVSLNIEQNETPIVLQVGGSNPDKLAQCARAAEIEGYQAININIGCPSKPVKSGQFGACLFKTPQKVAHCVEKMTQQANIAVTIKTRIGVDETDSEKDLFNFIRINANAGCKTFIIHARKAWLSGLSPTQNRTIPPIIYQRVYAVKKAFRELSIIINGEIKSADACQTHLEHVNGVMIGRAICKQPLLLQKIEKTLFNHKGLGFDQAITRYLSYVEQKMIQGEKLNFLLQPLQHLFYNQTGAKLWRRMLDEFLNHQKIDLLFKHIKQKIVEQPS